MKKRSAILLSLVLVLCLCFALSACGLFGDGTNNGGLGGGSQSKTDSDGTFVYTGSSVKAANTSLSGAIVIPSEHNGTAIDTIPENAFKGCNAITSITVPNSVTSIGSGAFNGCSSLRSITLPFVGSQKGNSGSSNALFGYIFGTSSYQGSTSVEQRYGTGVGQNKYYYIPSTLRTVTITNETVISYGAFQNCSMLTKLDLNDGIIQVGSQSFENCSQIEEINLPNISILPSSLFKGCISLSKFTINPSVDTIEESAFSGCGALTSVNSDTAGTFVIPDAVTSIGKGAFNGCPLIKSITLPFVGSKKGNSGSSNALFGYIFGTNYYQGSTTVKQDYIGSASLISYYIPSALRTVTITNETVIAYGAFLNCSMLQTITINKAAQNDVGKRAFENTAVPTWI